MEDRVVRGIPYIVHLSMLTVILVIVDGMFSVWMSAGCPGPVLSTMYLDFIILGTLLIREVVPVFWSLCAWFRDYDILEFIYFKFIIYYAI